MDPLPEPRTGSGFGGLHPLSGSYTVTGVASNLLHSLDGRNPTQELLKLIQKQGIDADEASIFGKEGEFYLTVINEHKPQTVSSLTPLAH